MSLHGPYIQMWRQGDRQISDKLINTPIMIIWLRSWKCYEENESAANLNVGGQRFY